MNLTLKKWLMILGAAVVALIICTGFLTHQLLQEQKRAKALEKSNQIFEKDNEALRNKNFSLNDSLQVIKEKTKKDISNRDKTIEEMLTYIDSLLKTDLQNEKSIDNITNADSLQQLFTRHYPDNRAASQGGH